MSFSLVPAGVCGHQWSNVCLYAQMVAQHGGDTWGQRKKAQEWEWTSEREEKSSQDLASDGSDATFNVLKLGLVFIDAGSDLHLSVQKRL